MGKKLQGVAGETSVIRELEILGMKPEELEQMKKWRSRTRKRICRFQMLEDIHIRQQSLDRLDYIIYVMQQN